MTTLHTLPKSTKRHTRRGRGIAAGKGKTGGRGTKGQKARAGHNIPSGFEGGQTKLFMRLPKRRGESNAPKPGKATVTLGMLSSSFETGERVTLSTLKRKGLVSTKTRQVTVVATGTLDKSLKFAGLHFTASAHKLVYPDLQTETTAASK